MIFNLKTLAVAVGLAVVAGSASAAIRLPGDTGGNGSELFAVIYDTESKASFMKDLGIELQNFLPTPSAPASLPAFTLTGDANWASFLALTDGSPTLRFMVAGADTTGGTNPNGQRFMATGASNPFANLTNNNISANLPAAAIKYLSDHQNRGSHSSATPVSENGSSVTTDDLGINFGKAGTMTPTWNGVTGNMTGALGDSLNFYFITRSSSGAGTTKPGGDQFDNQFGPATWTFKQTGNDYQLTYMAPVPEPETWALMLAGMAIVGSVARRRRAK
jgi:hypothetical protein